MAEAEAAAVAKPLQLAHTHTQTGARTRTVLPLVFYGCARQLGMPSSNVALTGLPWAACRTPFQVRSVIILCAINLPP